MSVSSPIIAGSSRYDTLTIALHWMTALLVAFQFALGETWNLPTRPVHHLMVVAHLTAGICLTVIMMLRVGWRLTKGRYLSKLLSPLDRMWALGMEYTLYILLLAEIGLGYLWRWGSGQAISFFNLSLPSPLMRFQTKTLEWIQSLHHWNAWLIVGLAIGHGGAALFHQFILKDRVLERMLYRKP
ncbi:cytochrome b [Acetobacter estunensis]|uniref:cytochrome b n=1 Tax=Acetobacter estunensis TaxID=104097 RepID=UPI001C2DA8E3|nr:cytochrome b/b6 domain-containing protein [Acetobacter estunensis]MBV1838715.1 cytochrome b/b6 domain-containing protein [Acetobacter estunensis]